MSANKTHKNKVPRVLFICFMFVILIETLFDPVSDIVVYGSKLQAHVGFPRARDRWNATHIDHYSYDVSMFIHNSPCLWQGNLEIKDDVVVAARRRSDWPADLSTLDIPVFPIYEPKPDTEFLCNYHNFTVSKLFNAFGEWLDKSESLYKVSYDQEYGFISEARFGSPANRGLLRFKSWHCCNGFTIENFRSLDQ